MQANLNIFSSRNFKVFGEMLAFSCLRSMQTRQTRQQFSLLPLIAKRQFKILEKHSCVTYLLDLFPILRFHPVMYVANLKRHYAEPLLMIWLVNIPYSAPDSFPDEDILPDTPLKVLDKTVTHRSLGNLLGQV